MPRFTQLLYLTGTLLVAVRICDAACIPEDSPEPPNRDALARLLAAEEHEASPVYLLMGGSYSGSAYATRKSPSFVLARP